MGMQIVITIIKIALKILHKVLVFTGGYIVVAWFFIGVYIMDNHKGLSKAQWFNDVGVFLLVVCLFIMLLTTIQNIIRLVRPDFSIISLISARRRVRRKEVGEKFEKVDKQFVGLESGVVLGKLKREYLVMPQNTEGHIMVIGGQGSGKSSCVAIPTLLNYNGSIFAVDIKGELSESRKDYAVGNIKIFNPVNSTSPHYDPYVVLSEGNKIQSVREMAQSIVKITKEDKDPYWKQSAQNLLIACILNFENQNMDFPQTCKAIMSNNIKELLELLEASPVTEVQLFINQFVGADEKQLASIYSTLANEIILFATDEYIMRSLSRNDDLIIPSDLERMTDIFIKIDEDKLEQWKPLLNLMVSQFLKSFEKRKNNNSEKILFMLDEFARLGKIENITNGLATLRSKGIQIMIILQSLAQLDMIYGKDNRKVITDNCNYKIILNASDSDTQEYFSKLVGTVDIEKKSISASKKATDIINNNGVSKSSEEKRIIKPEAFAYLEQPVVFTPSGYFRPNKVKWYEDKIFLERANNNYCAF